MAYASNDRMPKFPLHEGMHCKPTSSIGKRCEELHRRAIFLLSIRSGRSKVSGDALVKKTFLHAMSIPD
jgi:hypothetical protein